MIGVPFYFISERIFKKEVFNPRNKIDTSSKFKRMLHYFLKIYFQYIENKISFGIGLTLFTVCQKKEIDK